MKRTAMIIAGLMTLGSATAFAEGGAERMRYYYESLHQAQEQAVQSAQLRVPDDQTAQMTESYRPK
jgi:hypothetical protein